ncbi:hypothetical protein SPRG_20663 [Saprolegnia parasitica CBS 223.65]|uniref:Uncharacterized protein n=1 Tax=Saprolegnia parasitica (strain CBS 223.65) TaxID=695850 RepID=A0A067C8P9_SAPPC|nr:hypothetical protein SPRG_20663 [Saprolegnia parasitica CBS 223.65]KDO25540.1 hypothetical protein SPRG_20663 [Saprolegnia parasitica CBS 223.65]|eukprot:XP_012203769.1 hypothetical protein SPRG_20663 [Saprolegnia parasitica CBS 223.65]
MDATHHLTYRVDDVEYVAVYDTTVQHIPLRKDLSHLRPPPPRLTDKRDIFIGVTAYRDGVKCGFTLWTAFSRAAHPERVFFGVVDQTLDGDVACFNAYCERARETWPDEPCKYQSQIKIDARSATTSKGPVVSRAQLYPLLGDQGFSMMIDSHVQFAQKWDDLIIAEWAATENEMAVLSNYPINYDHLDADATFTGNYAPHVCNFMPRPAASSVIYYSGILVAYNFEHPLLSVSWAGGFSFGKSHSWHRAPMDPYMNWVFWGEEFLHAYQLWTRGYDMYSPSRHGNVVFHNWTDNGDKHRFTDNVTRVTTQAEHDREEAMAYNRFHLIFQQPFSGEVDSREIDKYGSGSVRSREQFMKFSNISMTNARKDFAACNQLHFVPYTDPTELEALLPGWRFADSTGLLRTDAVTVNNSVLHDLRGKLDDAETTVTQLRHAVEAARLEQTTGFQLLETARKELEEKEQATLREMQLTVTQLRHAVEAARLEQTTGFQLLETARKELEEKEQATLREVQLTLEKVAQHNSRAISGVSLRLRQIQETSTQVYTELALVVLVLVTVLTALFGRCWGKRGSKSVSYTKLESTD